MVSKAHNDGDIVLELCLRDKAEQMTVALQAAQDRVDSMEGAVQSGNLERVQVDNSVMGALQERSGAITAEANQCIGEEKGKIGGAQLEVTVDPDIPGADVALGTGPASRL